MPQYLGQHAGWSNVASLYFEPRFKVYRCEAPFSTHILVGSPGRVLVDVYESLIVYGTADHKCALTLSIRGDFDTERWERMYVLFGIFVFPSIQSLLGLLNVSSEGSTQVDFFALHYLAGMAMLTLNSPTDGKMPRLSQRCVSELGEKGQ